MSVPSPTERRAERIAEAMLAVCSILALMHLPHQELPAGWLLAFVLPGAVLGRCSRLRLRGWHRTMLAVVLQVAACWLALTLVGPMSRPAALACTILPPLGFATARHQPSDRPLALFLGFCVVLIGVILDGPQLGLLAAWIAAACLALRSADHLAAHADTQVIAQQVPAARTAWKSAAALVAATLCCVFALEFGLSLLPSPSRAKTPGSSASGANTDRVSGAPRVGLDDTFTLDNSSGGLADDGDELLVRAIAPANRTVPPGLYLRTGFHAEADLAEWRPGRLDLVELRAGDCELAPRVRAEVQQLSLERFPAGSAFVFVPPHTNRITGLRNLNVDVRREWVRQHGPGSMQPYDVSFAMPRPPADDAVAFASAELLQLPRGFDRSRWQALLNEWQVPAAPVAAMARIATKLTEHCRYERSEPSGPFPTAIENFLFSPTPRRGYCMHFASAAALLLRVHGIPCRIGVGVHNGRRDRDRAEARLFSAENAHAWVEVPLQGHGFVVFDPTPAAERGQRNGTPRDPDGQPLDVTLPDDDAAEPVPEPSADLPGVDFRHAILAALAALATILLLRSPRRAFAPSLQAAESAVPAAARRLLAQLLHELAAAGHARPPGASLESLARTIAAQKNVPAAAIASAFAAYQEVRFGDLPFDAGRERTLSEAVAATRTWRLSSASTTP